MERGGGGLADAGRAWLGSQDLVVEKGDQVAIHYVGTLESGEEFDASRPRGSPLSFTVGTGQMIPGFDKGVMGLAKGETKSMKLPPEDVSLPPPPFLSPRLASS